MVASVSSSYTTATYSWCSEMQSQAQSLMLSE